VGGGPVGGGQWAAGQWAAGARTANALSRSSKVKQFSTVRLGSKTNLLMHRQSLRVCDCCLLPYRYAQSLPNFPLMLYDEMRIVKHIPKMAGWIRLSHLIFNPLFREYPHPEALPYTKDPQKTSIEHLR